MMKAPKHKSGTCYIVAALMMVVCLLGACKKNGIVDITTMTVAQRAAIAGLTIPPDSIKVDIGLLATRVTFCVVDGYGQPVVGIETLIADDDRYVRFTMCKLVAGANGDADSWFSYIRDEDGLPFYDSPRQGGMLVANTDKSYTYTFAYNVRANAAYANWVTHRLGGQLGNSSAGLEALNISFDFMPSGMPVRTKRDISMTSSCNECHGKLVIHGRRFEVGYCDTCHNPDNVIDDDSFDMGPMTHKIHAADPDYFNGAFAEVTYPQDLTNCRKCHDGADAGTPQGDNWKTKPTIAACGSCHRNVDFATGTGHAAGAQSDNTKCALCHPASAIEEYHLTANATPNNPDLPAGVPVMAYAIREVTVDGSGAPTIIFSITADGAAIDVNALPAGFSGSPGFLLAWTEEQDGIATPADYNNLGRKAGQPISVSLEDIVAGTDGTVVCSGNCTAVLNEAFPAGAKMRAIGLQGYYSITVGIDEYSLHTPSVVKAVTGDAERRTVVDSSKCANCHEWFEGHGGSRVLNMQICVLCHVPNLSSSGREITAPNAEIIAELGADTLIYPEATQNMKDMIHGIHSSAYRTVDYEHVRNRNNGLYYNWSEVTFPTEVGNCLVCHDDETYLLPLPANQLATTNRTTGEADGQDDSQAAVTTARVSVPNDTDWVITPVTAACYSCHTTDEAILHMMWDFGGFLSQTKDFTDIEDSIISNRDTVLAAGNTESCIVCHGAGRSHDVQTVHTSLSE